MANIVKLNYTADEINEKLESVSSKANLPKDISGNISNGISGQILLTNGDGTTAWADVADNAEIKRINTNMELLNMGNLINLETINNGLIMNDGTVANDSRYCHTDFIPVIAGSTLNFKVYSDSPILGKIRYLAAYDANKTVMSSLGLGASADVYVVPDGVSYIKASIRVEDVEYAVLINGNLPNEYISYVGDSYFATEDFLGTATYNKSQIDSKFDKNRNEAAYATQQAIQKDVVIPIIFEQGNLNSTTGLETTSEANYFVRSTDKIVAKFGDEIKIMPNGQQFYLFKYDINGNFVERSNLTWTDTTIQITDDCYYRIVVKKASAYIVPEEVSVVCTITTNLYNRHGLTTLNTAYVKESVEVTEDILDETSHLRLLCFADPHDFSAHKYLKYNEIMSHGVVDYLVGLGDYVDYVNRGNDKSIYRKLLLDAINKSGRESNCIYVIGNHDTSMKPGAAVGSSDIDLVMRPMECFDIFYRHLKTKGNIVVDSENPYGCYFYIDDTQSKTRMIILNSNEICNDDGTVTWCFEQTRMSQRQLDWFAKTALHVKEDGWSVIVFLHNVTPYRSNYILFEILEAAKTGSALNKTFTAYDRMMTDENGNATSEIDIENGDTYTVNVDYSNEEYKIDVIAVVHGHSHMSDDALINGIRRIQVRTDNALLDDFYHCQFTPAANTTYYFTDILGHIYSFTTAENVSETVTQFGYNAYLTQYGAGQTIAHIYDVNGRITDNPKIYFNESIPVGATELTNFVRERDGSVTGDESCEIFCINKNSRTITTIPYGTGTKRVISY